MRTALAALALFGLGRAYEYLRRDGTRATRERYATEVDYSTRLAEDAEELRYERDYCGALRAGYDEDAAAAWANEQHEFRAIAERLPELADLDTWETS